MATPALLPFLVHADPHDPVAWRGGRPVSRQHFVADVQRLAARLPDAGHAVNACTDRYWLAVGFAAAMVRGQVSVLPGNLLAGTLQGLAARFPGLYALVDNEPAAPLPELRVDDADGMAPEADDRRTPAGTAIDMAAPVPAFEPERIAAILFTSGSTGEPVAHPRRWGAIVASARAEAARLGMSAARPLAVLGTVPAQHSYGFESTLHLPLQGAGILVAERPFFPADIQDQMAALPRPRMLVTTPVHLRALLGSGAAATPADLLLCATSPLDPELAREAEARYGCELHEIYGCTEAGQVATRRTSDGPTWLTLDGVSFIQREGTTFATGGHVGPPTALADVIELHDPQRFTLRGRTSDMVNIAGKRSSVTFLESQLLAIPGVRDGAFLAGDDATGSTRLTAFAVAPGMEAAQLMAELRTRIEAAFLPRPLHLVDALPREATGKLQRQRLVAMAAALARPRSAASPATATPTPAADAARDAVATVQPGTVLGPIAVPERAAVFDGHFPGDPMLPGARVLDLALRALREARLLGPGPLSLGSVKFLSPVRPGARLSVHVDPAADGGLKFVARVGDTAVASGAVRSDAPR